MTAAGLAAGAFLFGAPLRSGAASSEGPSASATPEALLERVNASRSDRGLPPLRLEPALAALAAERAAASQSGPLDFQDAARRDRDAAEERGFEARSFAELYVGSEGGAATILVNASRSAEFEEEIARAGNTSIGIGVARRGGMGLYVFLFASSFSEHFAASTAPLGNLDRIRAEMLARVNGERAAAGRIPLRAQKLLDEAALRHARDMLARSYYGHASPDGRTPLDRARAAGYRTALVGENIARGPYTVAEVMDAWMKSPDHRSHILSPEFRETGSAVAVGRNDAGYQVIWVQCFGKAQDAEPVRGRRR
ncbi:MAG: CAP domain-containing protein [Acidobacteriota bacterium]